MTPLPDVLPPQVACPACTPSDDELAAALGDQLLAVYLDIRDTCIPEAQARDEKWKKEHPTW